MARPFLTYKNASRIFWPLIVLMVIAGWYHLISWWWLLLPILLFNGLLVYGSMYVCSQFYSPVICEGDKSQKQIALTFDDGPVLDVTDQVLQVLSEHNVKGTFFCIGERLAQNRELGQRIHQEGHLLGNHSFHHGFWFDLLPAAKMERELWQTDEEIAAITGEQPEWLRPPYGVTNPALAKAAQQTGHKLAGWSVRSMDTVNKDAKAIAENVKRQLKPGAIILFHDSQPLLPEVLEDVIAFAKKEGYELRRFDEMVEG